MRNGLELTFQEPDSEITVMVEIHDLDTLFGYGLNNDMDSQEVLNEMLNDWDCKRID